jgi:D-alanine-D-alanine ligase
MSKLNVAVLRGSPSREYLTSLASGAHVLQHLPERYRGHDIFISRDGEWHRDGATRTPDRALAGMDVVINALHGDYGEDGKVQKLLHHFGIPYTGSDALSSAVAMNKLLAKKTLAANGIKSPYHILVRAEDNIPEKIEYIFHHFFAPFIVKPADASSSVGITLVKSFAETEQAILDALDVSDAVLVEEFVRGKEATCGVIDGFRGQKIYTLLPVEIVHPGAGPFNHAIKRNGISEERYPASFSDQEKEEIQNLARLAHQALGLRHYSHSDFIVTPRRGIYILEVNTLPSLAPGRAFAQFARDYRQFDAGILDHIIRLAREES